MAGDYDRGHFRRKLSRERGEERELSVRSGSWNG